MNALVEITGLPMLHLVLLGLITFVAGVVRGFSGFALSAVVMATALFILPPVKLIPILWFLELSANILMVRNGIKEANMSVVMGLVIGSVLGYPIGLSLTHSLPVETSKLVALCIVLTLAFTQILRVRLAFLATLPGLYGAGLISGVVSGLASVGGMVVALYVLASPAPAREMRASLVMYLTVSLISSLVFLISYGMMDRATISLGLLFSLPTMLGVAVGKQMFSPRLEPYYRPFCLSLLMVLAGTGILRLAT